MNITKTPSALYSIGHSNHPIDHFLDLLQQHGIQAVADVRSSSYSRHNPQFCGPDLERSLKDRGIAYVFLGDELGARRHEPECYADGKVNYEKVPAAKAFQRGITRLLDGASKTRVAMLCAEKDPLTCHRTILIGRHVKGLVGDVLHILADGEIETQSQAEERLLVECKLAERNFFATREERLLEAYQKRGTHIAYEEPAPHV